MFLTEYDETDEACSIHVKGEKCTRSSSRKTLKEDLYVFDRRIILKCTVKEIQCGAVDWLSLCQGQLQWQVIVTEACSCSFKRNVDLFTILYQQMHFNISYNIRILYGTLLHVRHRGAILRELYVP